jgi:hypothetical protein
MLPIAKLKNPCFPLKSGERMGRGSPGDTRGIFLGTLKNIPQKWGESKGDLCRYNGKKPNIRA